MSSSRPSFHTASTNSRTFSLLSSLTFFTCAMVSAALVAVQGRIPEGFPSGFVTQRPPLYRRICVVRHGRVLLERERELETLREGLDRARAGEGTLLLIEGPAGVGKTALARAARAVAGREG